MAIETTCIGAYPKPSYLNVGTMAETEGNDASEEQTRTCTYVADRPDEDDTELLDQATREAVLDQRGQNKLF